MVRALLPVATTVILALPVTKYCHSSALGCQCNSRSPPGRTVTKAIVVEVILKLLESTMRTSPPLVDLVGCISIVRKAKSVADDPSAPADALRSAASEPGSWVWKMKSSWRGKFLNAALSTPKFLARTDGGRWAIESLSSTVSASEKLP